MGFAQASCWAKLALVAVILGTILDIVGVATPSWIIFDDGNTKVDVGLWTLTSCNGTLCTTVTIPTVYSNTLFNVMRIMETIGVVLAVTCIFMLFIYVCADALRTVRFARATMVMCILTGTVIFVGMCLCLAYVPAPYVVGYSLGLTVLGYLLILIGGSLLIPDSCDPKDDYDDDYDYDYDYNSRRRKY